MDRHRHLTPYAALVLSGGYVEAGDQGRYSVQAGQVLVHAPYEAHQNSFPRTGAVVLNLPAEGRFAGASGTVADPDAIAALAEKDPFAASQMLQETFVPVDLSVSDWPDLLAIALCAGQDFSLETWAEATGVAPATVSRGFRRVYGTTPQRYRLEHRTLRALRLLPAWRGTVADLAAETGFSDQAHLTRSVVSLTGATPGRLRIKYVQASAAHGG
ncbi:MAG TPA: AraC family transcriptional regulator [Acidobacteriaceae bacterium]|jgi:AraC-like DNA-binding protein|nr:AraC family transcriptional regulator [Acidobacteriaceae bacterium]